MTNPSFWDQWEWARAHQKPEPELAVDNSRSLRAPKVPVLLDPPKTQFESKVLPPKVSDISLGREFCRVAIPLSKALIARGGEFEDAGLKGVVVGGTLAGIGGIVAGPPGAVPGGLLATVSAGAGSAGSVAHGLGAGLLWAATGNTRPVLEAGISQATGKFAPPLAQPYVDYATAKGLNTVFGPDEDPECRW